MVTLCCQFSSIHGFCADTSSIQYSEPDTVFQSFSEDVDTIWIDDSVLIDDTINKGSSSQALVDTVNTTRPVQDTTELPLSDTTPIHELYTITVYGKRPTGKDAAAVPTIVKGASIRESLRSTPLEELSQESGDIYVTSKGTGLHGVASGASGGIYIRGLGGSPNSQILVVEDGVPDYQGIFGHPIPDAFFPSLIDRVMVVKGGDGVLYGTNAMGGVIIIENRWPYVEGYQFENDVAYGSYNTFRDRATFAFKGEKADIVSAFSAFSTDGHRDGTDGNSLAGQFGIRLHLPGKFTMIVKDKGIRLEGGDPGPYISPTTDHRFEVLRNSLNAILEYSGHSSSFSLIPWLNAGEHRLYDGFFSRDYTAGAIAEYSLSIIEQKLQIISGGAGEYVDGTVLNKITNIESPVKELSSIGFYGQVTAKPGMGLTGVLGGRWHHSNQYGTVPLYKASLCWEPFECVKLHTRVSKNFRQPTLRELYLPFPVANADLRPETAVNWDAGSELRFGPVKIGSSVFKTWATDMIKYFGQWPSAEVVNIDKLEIWGVESELAIDAIGPINIFLTGSWQDVGRFTKQNPDSKLNGRISYTAEGKSGRLECSVSGEWVHGIYMNNYRRDPLDDILFIDGSFRYRMQSRSDVQLEPYCIIRNLLNSRYEYIEYYRMPGINILAGITIKV